MFLLSRRKIAALAAEFLGTGVLAFVVLAVKNSQIGIPYFVAIAAGLVVVLFGAALGRDAILNPALTLGLWTGRRIKTVKALLFIAVQLLGGLAAYSLYKYFTKGQPVQPIPSAFDAHVLVSEAFGMFVFSFIVVGVGFRKLADVTRNSVAGFGLTLGIMVASVASAGFINPAVALAANAWAWSTYVAGPVLGAIIGVNLYALLFADKEKASGTNSSSSSASTARVVTANVVADSKAVKADRLEKVERAEKKARAAKKKK
jgi:aquaporin Z